MLPPLIPLSAVPVTSQTDPPRQTPDIPPVAPVQPGSSETTIDMRERDQEQAALQLREEQRRQQRRKRGRRAEDRLEDDTVTLDGEYLNADNTVPIAPLMDDQPRQGLWVDLKV